jgi:PAS domain S-box-containing protein
VTWTLPESRSVTPPRSHSAAFGSVHLQILGERVVSSPNESFAQDERQNIFFQYFEFAPDAMLVVDERGTVKQVNAKTEEAFGYTRSELIGRPVETLVPERFAAGDTAFRNGVGVRKDGTEFPIDIMISPVQTKEGPMILASVRGRDCKNEDKLAEEVKRSATLLKEVHHRVKNNLQIVSSLLYLRSTQDVDPSVRQVLRECQARVRSIGLIHEKLYRSPVHGKINLADYINDFVAELIRTYEIPGNRIQVHTRLEPAYVGADTVLPCALIVHELVSNVFLHAFPNQESGEVRVELGFEDGRHVLSVQDNGSGMPDLRQASNSLGLTLVRDLATQLRGQLEVEVAKGTRVRILFSEIEASLQR